MEILELAKYGSAGQTIALIFIILYVIKELFRVSNGYREILENHLQHMEEAYRKNSEVTEENTKAITRFQDIAENCRKKS